MYDAQLPCLGEGQILCSFISICIILKSVHLPKSSGALKKKKKHLEHLLCDGKDDSNLLFLYVCQLSITGR